MRTTRFITAGLVVALVSGAIAGPAVAVPALDHAGKTGASATQSATPVSGESRLIPQPPTWPLHPQPITQKVATMADGRPIPQPPTWPLHPKVIPPPAPAPHATLVAHHSTSSFDWSAAAVGAATTLAVLAMVLAAAVAIRRRRVGPRTRLT
jgi:hypothetical protein